MGLRERNAAQTRDHILKTALTLFIAQGYEATKMEEVAERADLSVSTLYRYFPTKEQLVTEPLALRGQMAAELLERPETEPLDVALGHAIAALVTTPRPDMERMRQLAVVVESAPGPQARLRDEFIRERELLAQAIAQRAGREVDDPFCQMTARITTSVLEILGAREHGDVVPDNATAAQNLVLHLGQLLDQIREDPPIVPRLPH